MVLAWRIVSLWARSHRQGAKGLTLRVPDLKSLLSEAKPTEAQSPAEMQAVVGMLKAKYGKKIRIREQRADGQ